MISKDTYTYKVIDNCEIKADIYSVKENVLRPVIMWLHGGALIFGTRKRILSEQVEIYINAGFNVVSVDYRLAPETKIADIVEDVKDAYLWICEAGSELFNSDPDRIAVMGTSAGGYLALMSGFYVNPRPFALVSFYGYGDISGSWYSQADEYYCRQPLVSKEEAFSVVGNKAISSSSEQNNRWPFYLYCRQNGLWPEEVTGHDPKTENEFFVPFCPIQNVTKDYPPTVLLHGDMDTDVPYEQSEMMAKELARVGVDHELITIPGGGHGFDRAGTNDPEVATVFNRVIVFLNNYLNYLR